MDTIKEVWQFLNGRKRDIGAYAGVIIGWLVTEGRIDAGTARIIMTCLTIWVSGAATHAGIKGDL